MKDVTYYKEILEEQKKELEEELSTLGIHDANDPANWEATAPKMDIMHADENEAADAIEEGNLDANVLNTLEIRYRNILHALGKIEKNTYGTCEVSGEEIEEDRLEANPAARTCKQHLESEDQLER